MIVEHWQGAQWVLVTIFVMMSCINCLALPYQKGKDAAQKAGWLLAKFTERGWLIAILYWGGFWS